MNNKQISSITGLVIGSAASMTAGAAFAGLASAALPKTAISSIIVFVGSTGIGYTVGEYVGGRSALAVELLLEENR